MFLLFLTGLGTADVNAQVRIGGNAAPNASAVLDLNASDGVNLNAATAVPGTKGLALPRVSLTSDTMRLTGVVNQITGLLVYNVNNTFLPTGIYTWTGGASGKWHRVDAVPDPTPKDSGLFLTSTGSGTIWRSLGYGSYPNIDTLRLLSTTPPVSWTLILDTTYRGNWPANTMPRFYAAGLRKTDVCTPASVDGLMRYTCNTDMIYAVSLLRQAGGSTAISVRCYRPSL